MEARRRFIGLLLLVIIAVTWLANSVSAGDVVALVIGLALVLGSLSSFLHMLNTKSLNTVRWRLLLEIALTVLIPIVTLSGYFLTGSILLLVLTLLMTLSLVLGLILSYVIPKIRRMKTA